MRTTIPVTVVIPAFNAEATLAETIESVHAQSLTPYEILVVDDGSSDATSSVARQCGARLLRQSNSGSSVARNAGIQAAQHPWIAFLDADDLWEPDKLASQWSAIRSWPSVGVVTNDYVRFSSDGRLGNQETGLTSGDSGYWAWTEFGQLDGARFFGIEGPGSTEIRSILAASAPCSSFLVKRDILLAAKGFNPSLNMLEDYEFFLRVLSMSSVAVVERPLTRYRLHSAAKSRSEVAGIRAYVRIVEMIEAEPALYPRGAADLLCKPVPRKLADAGRLLLDLGDRGGARELFLRSFLMRISPRVLNLWLASWLPDSYFRQAIVLKRHIRALRTTGKLSPTQSEL